MTFWLVLGALALVSGLWIARPYLRSRSVEMTGADGAISIYRDQIDELERDRDPTLALRLEPHEEARHLAQDADAEQRLPELLLALEVGHIDDDRVHGDDGC